MKIKKIIFSLILIVNLVSVVNAKYIDHGKVRYSANYGWSHYYDVNILYMTGYELNREMISFNYDHSSTYAIIF